MLLSSRSLSSQVLLLAHIVMIVGKVSSERIVSTRDIPRMVNILPKIQLRPYQVCELGQTPYESSAARTIGKANRIGLVSRQAVLAFRAARRRLERGIWRESSVDAMTKHFMSQELVTYNRDEKSHSLANLVYFPDLSRSPSEKYIQVCRQIIAVDLEAACTCCTSSGSSQSYPSVVNMAR